MHVHVRRHHPLHGHDHPGREGEQPRAGGSDPQRVHRSGRAAHQLDRHEVQKNPRAGGQRVLRLPVRARPVVDRELRDARAGLGGVDREQTAHLAIEPHALDHLPPKRLQRAAEIADADPDQSSHHAVRDP